MRGNRQAGRSATYVEQGRSNAVIRLGRPTSLFAPRSARLARVLLQDAARPSVAGELVALTGLSRGYLSRLLPRYEEAGFVERTSVGRAVHVRASRPDRLLDAWRADVDFGRHLARGNRIHFMRPDGWAIGDDTPQAFERVRQAGLHVACVLGDWMEQVTLIVGAVPSLLIGQDQLPSGVYLHPGIADLDLGLALAVLHEEGYAGIAQLLRAAGSRAQTKEEDRLRRQTWRTDPELGPKVTAVASLADDYGTVGSIGPTRTAAVVRGPRHSANSDDWAELRASAFAYVQRLSTPLG